MLQSPELKYSPAPSPANSYTPANSASLNTDQTHIGRSVVIKGEVSGAESLFIDGRIEGTITSPDHRVTVGRHGNVAANISAKEVVIMGNVQGNVDCADRLDIRSEGVLAGDVITHRISIEEGAILKGGVEVRNPEKKEQKIQQPGQQHQTQQNQQPSQQNQTLQSQVKPAEAPKTMAAIAGKA